MKFHVILFLVTLVTILFVLRFKHGRLRSFKNIVLPVFFIIFIICLMVYSETAVKSARNGIELWFNIVFPSLFPFFVASELLYKSGIVKAVGILLEPLMRPLFNVPGCGSFPFTMGVISGYPVGAKLTAGLRLEKLLTKVEAERLLAFSNNSGPLFIIGAVAVGMYNSPRLGVLLLGCHIAACITVGLIFRFYGRKKDIIKQSSSRNLYANFKKELFQNNSKLNFGVLFGEAIKNSVAMMLAIGGFIIFFSVIINLLLETGIIQMAASLLLPILSPLGIHDNIATALLSGFFEITTGTSMTSKALGTPFIQQVTSAGMIIGWAGLSVHSQVLSIISSTDISIKPYLLGKFIQGIISGIYVFLIVKIAGNTFLKDQPAFYPISSELQIHWMDYFLSSCRSMMLCLICLGVFAVMNLTVNRLLKMILRIMQLS